VGGEALAHGEEASGGDTDEDGDKRYSPGGVDVAKNAPFCITIEGGPKIDHLYEASVGDGICQL
jgi:hypothetical protein